MKYLERFNWFKKKVEGPFDNFDKEKWKKYNVPGIDVMLKIQPNFSLSNHLIKTVTETLEKIELLSKKWNIVWNIAELYSLSNSDNIKFKISDSSGPDPIFGTNPGPIPDDIKKELLTDIRRYFPSSSIGNLQFNPIQYFEKRGYFLVVVCIAMD